MESRKQKLYAVLDTTAELYSAMPFPSQNDGTALRAFNEALTHSDSDMAKNPYDYVLFAVGEYDRVDGTLHPAEPIIKLMTGAELLHVKKDNTEVS